MGFWFNEDLNASLFHQFVLQVCGTLLSIVEFEHSFDAQVKSLLLEWRRNSWCFVICCMLKYGMLLISECHGSLSWFDSDYGLLVAYCNIILQVVVLQLCWRCWEDNPGQEQTLQWTRKVACQICQIHPWFAQECREQCRNQRIGCWCSIYFSYPSQSSTKAKTPNIQSSWKNQPLHVIPMPHRVGTIWKGRTCQEGAWDPIGF